MMRMIKNWPRTDILSSFNCHAMSHFLLVVATTILPTPSTGNSRWAGARRPAALHRDTQASSTTLAAATVGGSPSEVSGVTRIVSMPCRFPNTTSVR